jgi:hypothetical protein
VSRHVPALLVVACAMAAAVLAVLGLGSSIVAPVAADVLMAAAFGIMAGTVMERGSAREQTGGGPDDV